jgi:hypothetical protein
MFKTIRKTPNYLGYLQENIVMTLLTEAAREPLQV